jgi:predicted Fe-Mo cluster-binding NifX family protein
LKLLIASEDHLGLNSNVYEQILDAPYFTVVDYNSEKVNKVINLENELSENKVNDFMQLIAEKNVNTVICNELSLELKHRLKEKDVNIVFNKKGRIADLIKNL